MHDMTNQVVRNQMAEMGEGVGGEILLELLSEISLYNVCTASLLSSA